MATPCWWHPLMCTPRCMRLERTAPLEMEHDGDRESGSGYTCSYASSEGT